MTQALKYLNVELGITSVDRTTLAKYRAATIHHRLASLLHNTFRTEVNQMTSNSLPRSSRFRITLHVENVYEPWHLYIIKRLWNSSHRLRIH